MAAVPVAQPGERDVATRILAAAIVLLEEAGYDGFNTNALAARAGVNVATVYRHFPDKFEVLRRLAQHLFAERAERAVDALQGLVAAPDWRAFVRGFVASVMAARREQPGALAVRQALQAVPSLQVVARGDLDRLVDALADALARRRPSLGPQRARMVAKTVLVATSAVLDRAWDDPRCGDTLVDEASELVVRYLAPELD
jgi:AcrR family transcriptional regulator